jgi:hypothetical protein
MALGAIAEVGVSTSSANSLGDTATRSSIDHSSWTVATSGSKASAYRSQEENAMSEMSEMTKYLIFGAVAIAAVVFLMKKK